MSLAICSAAPNHQGAISNISDLMSFFDCHFSILSGNQFCKVLQLKVHVYFLQKLAECELIKVSHFDKLTHTTSFCSMQQRRVKTRVFSSLLLALFQALLAIFFTLFLPFLHALEVCTPGEMTALIRAALRGLRDEGRLSLHVYEPA